MAVAKLGGCTRIEILPRGRAILWNGDERLELPLSDTVSTVDLFTLTPKVHPQVLDDLKTAKEFARGIDKGELSRREGQVYVDGRLVSQRTWDWLREFVRNDLTLDMAKVRSFYAP